MYMHLFSTIYNCRHQPHSRFPFNPVIHLQTQEIGGISVLTRLFWKGHRSKPHKQVQTRILITSVYKMLTCHPQCEGQNFCSAARNWIYLPFGCCVCSKFILLPVAELSVQSPHYLQYLLPGKFPLWEHCNTCLCFFSQLHVCSFVSYPNT